MLKNTLIIIISILFFDNLATDNIIYKDTLKQIKNISTHLKSDHNININDYKNFSNIILELINKLDIKIENINLIVEILNYITENNITKLKYNSLDNKIYEFILPEYLKKQLSIESTKSKCFIYLLFVTSVIISVYLTYISSSGKSIENLIILNSGFFIPTLFTFLVAFATLSDTFEFFQKNININKANMDLNLAIDKLKNIIDKLEL